MNTKSLYNPLNKDFKTTYDINGDCKPIEFIIPGMQIVAFEEPIFIHMRKHLIDFVVNERGVNPTIPQNITDIEKEVDVDYES